MVELLSLKRWQLCLTFFTFLFMTLSFAAPAYEASVEDIEDVPIGQTAWSNIVYQEGYEKRSSQIPKKGTKQAKLTSLRPAIHWDTPIHSFDLLKGNKNQTLFFAPEQDAKPNSIVPMAWMHYHYQYPVVVLDHSAHVHSVQCFDEKTMVVTFANSKASGLTKHYATEDVVVTGHSFGNYHRGCKGIDKNSDRYYAKIEHVQIANRGKYYEVTFNIKMMSMHDVADGLTINHGHHTIAGSNPATSTKASTKTSSHSLTYATSSAKSTSHGTTSKPYTSTSNTLKSKSGITSETSAKTSTGKSSTSSGTSSAASTSTSTSTGTSSAASTSTSTSTGTSSAASTSTSTSTGTTSTSKGVPTVTQITRVPGPTVGTYDRNFDTNLDNAIGYFSGLSDAFFQQVFPGLDASVLANDVSKRAYLEKRHWWNSVAKAVAKAVVAVVTTVVKADIAIVKAVAKVAELATHLVAEAIQAIEPDATFHPFTDAPWDFSLPPSWLIPNYNTPFGSGFIIFKYQSETKGLSGTELSAPSKYLSTQVDGTIHLLSKTFSATIFCINCAFTGTPLTTGTVVVAYPLIDIVSATIRLHGPMQMHLEVGLDLTYEIGSSADGDEGISGGNLEKIKSEYKKKNPKKGSDTKELFDEPLDPYEIPGVVSLGATLQLKMGASITVAASGLISVGTDSYWSDYDYTLDLINPAYSISANTKMDLNKPFVNVGVALEATAQAYLGLCVMIGLDFFSGKLGIEGGVCDQAGVLAQVVLNLEWDEQTSSKRDSIEGRGLPLAIDAREESADLDKRETAEQLDVDLNECDGMGFAVYAYDYAYAEASVLGFVKDFSIWETSWYLTQSCYTLWTPTTLDIPDATGTSTATSTTSGAIITGTAAAGAGPSNSGPVATSTGVVEPSSPTQAATIGDYKLVGCYNNPLGFLDEDFEGIFGESFAIGSQFNEDMTPEICMNYCITRGGSYFGLMAGYECQCGNQIDLWYSDASLTTMDQCNTPSGGDANFLGGGYETILVYGRKEVVDSPGCPDIDGDTYSALNGQIFDMVCGQDNLGNDLVQGREHSLVECIEACASWNQVGYTPPCVGVAFVQSRDVEGYPNGMPCYLKNAFQAYDDNAGICAATLDSVVNSFGFKRNLIGRDDNSTDTGDNSTDTSDSDNSTDTVNQFGLTVLGGGNLTVPAPAAANATLTTYTAGPTIDFAANPTAYPYYQYNSYPVASNITFEDVTADELNITSDALASAAYVGTTDDPSYNDTAGSASWSNAFAAINDSLTNAAAANASFLLPSDSGNATSLEGYSSIVTLDSALQISANGDGNLYVVSFDSTNTDTTLQFAVDESGLTSTTYAGGLLHMYSDTMSAIGVSRLRASLTEYNIPLTAQAISFIPMHNLDAATNGTYPSVLVAETTSGSSMFYLAACVYSDTTLPVKLFVVNDPTTGPQTLESEKLQSTITGGVVSSCQLLGFSNGAAPVVE